MRVAISTAEGRADDLRTWSGTPVSIVNTMRSLNADVVVLDEPSPLLVRSGKVVAAATKRGRVKVNWEVEPWLVRRMTRDVQAQARSAQADVLLLLGWHTLGVHEGDLPTVLYTDATFAQRVDTAPHWQHLSARTRRLVEQIEGESLRQMAAVIMSSTVAYDDALARYRLNAARVHRIGFGASLVTAGTRPRLRVGDPPRLLAVGVKWERKGMDRCVLITDELQRRGIPAHLDVVGVQPPDSSWRRDYVTYHGFLRQDDAEDKARLEGLYAAADVFVLPTRSEPFGIVFAEAAASALPSLGSAIDGVPDVVRHGVSGLLLPAEASAGEYADRIQQLIAAPEAYAALSRGSIEHFRTALTWESAVRDVLSVCQAVVRQYRRQPPAPSSVG